MIKKDLIGYQNLTIKFKIPPGWTVELPIKTCVNNLFLNISNNDYYFEPTTKHHFVGLVKHLPDLVLNECQILLGSIDEKNLFEDYKFIYEAIYNHLVSNEGYITPNLHKFNSDYFKQISDIWIEFYDLINTIFKNNKHDLYVEKLTTSPVQVVWFSCMFLDLKNTFLENGLLAVNTTTSKKIWAKDAIKDINHKLELVLDGEKPVFYTDKEPTIYCNKSWILALARKLATIEKDDYISKKLKKYYQLEKQFFKKYRDSKDYQVGYINFSGTYIRGARGRTPDNL